MSICQTYTAVYHRSMFPSPTGPKCFMMYGRKVGKTESTKKKKSSSKVEVKSKKKKKTESKSKANDTAEITEVTFKAQPKKKTTKKITPKKPPLKRTARMRGPLPDLDDQIDLDSYVYGSLKHGASVKAETDDDDLVATFIGKGDTHVSQRSKTVSENKSDIFVDLNRPTHHVYSNTGKFVR